MEPEYGTELRSFADACRSACSLANDGTDCKIVDAGGMQKVKAGYTCPDLQKLYDDLVYEDEYEGVYGDDPVSSFLSRATEVLRDEEWRDQYLNQTTSELPLTQDADGTWHVDQQSLNDRVLTNTQFASVASDIRQLYDSGSSSYDSEEEDYGWPADV